MRTSIHNRQILRVIAAGLGLFSLLLLPPPLLAARDIPGNVTVMLNPSTTSIRWTLQDVLHTVHGTFTLKSGVIHLNPATGAAGGLIIIDAKSDESGSAARDERMQKNVLESNRYSEITFSPAQIFGDLDFSKGESVAVNGLFRLHGKDHPLQLQLRVSTQGHNTLQVTTQFVVPCVKWGLKDPSTFILRVGKTVVTDVSGTATVKS